MGFAKDSSDDFMLCYAFMTVQHLTLCGCWRLRLEAASREADGAHSLDEVGHVLPRASLSPLRGLRGLGGLRALLLWLILCFLDFFGLLLQFLKKKKTRNLSSAGGFIDFICSLCKKHRSKKPAC